MVKWEEKNEAPIPFRDCFVASLLAMTSVGQRLLRRFAPRNDGGMGYMIRVRRVVCDMW